MQITCCKLTLLHMQDEDYDEEMGAIINFAEREASRNATQSALQSKMTRVA